ncbi:photoreceptor outer segment membrane glycoprotein 2-like [Anneissia japonica]|uniref:photoreceptor outer segment membrane glycoprotein 2-like n=1 Tax=Anneissia japonica TaxID=1529436 RepID=UPI0014259C0A|nr:photoreceptor outer segment membrane glycoprotein 2-like [Anneissia japonica]
MACLSIHFSVDRRQKLATILQFFSWSCVICGIVLVSLGTFISLHVQAKVNLIEGYDGSILPKMLIIVGTLVVIIDLIGGKICQDISDHRRLHRFEMCLFPLVIILFLLDICVLTAACMCFAHRVQLSHSIHNGLVNAMYRYKDNMTYKVEIDELQQKFECCGNNGFEDWFNLQWIHNMYLNTEDKEIKSKMKTGEFLIDDVPFSCCRTNASRACIHHHVTDSDLHFNYRFPADLTIYQVGCRDQLIEYFSKKLKNIGTVAIYVFGLQFIIVICMRYLQTSIANARKNGDPKSDAPGWLFDKDAGKNEGGIEAVEAQHQPQEEEYSDDFDSDHFSSDDEKQPLYENQQIYQNDPICENDPIYENMQFLDELGGLGGGGNEKPGEKEKKRKSEKDGADKKNKSQKTKKNQSPTSKKNKSPTSKKNKSPTSKKSKSPTSKKNKSPMSKGTSKVGTKGKMGKKTNKMGGGKMKMSGKGKMGKRPRNRNRNNCDFSFSSSNYTSSSDEVEIFRVQETF